MKYSVNTILKVNSESEQVTIRILWFNDEIAYVCDINKNNVPYVILRSHIDELIQNGHVEIEDDDPYVTIVDEDDIPERYRKMRDGTWDIIKELVNQEPQIYYTKVRRKNVKEIAKQFDVSEISVMGYLKRYWKRGKTPNALLPDYYNCGGKGKERASGSAKRGRPRKYKEVVGEGINVTDDIKKVFTKSINKFYYTAAKNSLALTYELMRKEYFNDGYKKEEGIDVPVIKPQSQIPSFAQFRYWFEKDRNIKREITSRYSNKKFQKQYRAITGNANYGIIEPGIFEIDSQMGDIYLVSRFNRDWVIGRPIIYILVDKFSRIIAGFYISLETSYTSAMMAILNTYKNKVELCKQYDIEIKEEDWPVNMLPKKIIADRGELEGYNIENLINSLNVEISLTPPYRAELKSFVEKFHSVLNSLLKPHLPGVINLDGRERGDKDYRLNAKIDIFQFTQIVIKAILYYNNYSVLNNYKRSEDMISDNVKSIPKDLFIWGVSNRGGLFSNISEETVKLVLMPSAEATITAKGVRYKDMYYTSQNMLKEQIFVNARQKTWKVKISYDPRDLSYIYVHGDNPKDIEMCYITDQGSRYKDKTMEEIEYLLNIEKLQNEKLKDVDSQAKIKLITEIENIVKQANNNDSSAINDGISDKKRIENIRENRRIEKRENREKEKFILSKEDKQVKENRINEIENNPVDLLFKKQREEIQRYE